MIICSFNINGLNSILTKNKSIFLNYITNFDIICLQEIRMDKTKILNTNIIDELLDLSYDSYFYSSIKLGYSGVSIIIKNNIEDYDILYGINNTIFDNEARTITLILHSKKIILINSYSPNASTKLNKLDFRLQYDNEIKKFVDNLLIGYVNYESIICGDLNCALEPKDIKKLNSNNIDYYLKRPGYTNKERESFKTNYLVDYIDVFRNKYPHEKEYSWYSYMKTNNDAWRIDYFLLKNIDIVKDIKYDNSIKISDHIPVLLFLT